MNRTLHLLCWTIGCVAAAGAVSAADALVDPTRPVSAHVAPESQPESAAVHVQAIVSRAESRVAIVNGKVVRAGDHLGSISIQEVTAEGVRYLQHGQSNFARVPGARLLVRNTPVPKKEVP
jgi:hypothetical protein